MKNIVIILIIIFLVSIIYSHFVLDKTRYILKNKRFDKNMKVLFLSDLHNRNIVKKILEIVDIENPDIIIFGGDMSNERIKETDKVFKLIDKLKNKTIYYTFGNHEEMMNNKDYKLYLNKLNKTHAKILNNETIKLSQNINLIGFNSGIKAYFKFHKLGLSKKIILNSINKIDDKKYNIMIAHNPLEFSSYVDSNIDLVLSGHVHGGLARIPLIGGILSPDYTFFPKYDSGMYIKKRTRMIVSRGIGYSKRIPFRIFNPGEIVIISLMKD